MGERLAAESLQQHGLTILARNWQCAAGEIDIVAKESDVVVKTRRGRGTGAPEQGIIERKRLKLCELAQAYIDATGWQENVRIDLVGVALERSGRLLRVSYWREDVDCW